MNSIMNTSEDGTDQKRCCTFLIENTCFAVEADCVTEVLQRGVINNVPLASPAISGLLNLRGRIVPAIDLRIFLEFPPAPHTIKHISLIVDISNEFAGISAGDGVVINFQAESNYVYYCGIQISYK